MSTEAGFLADIRDHPDDVGRRLIFADWLEENDDAERAGFIRDQVRLEQLLPNDPERQEIEDRTLDTLARHRDEWLSGQPGWLLGAEQAFRRGLPGEVRLTPARALTQAKRLPQLMPVVRLTLTGINDRAAELVGSPLLANLAELEIDGVPIHHAALRKFLRHYDARSLRHFGLTGTGGRVGQSDPLSMWAGLSRLKSLSLRKMTFDDGRLAALLGSPNLGALERFELLGPGAGAGTMAAIAANPQLRGLRRLDLHKHALGTDGVRALTRAEFDRLECLRFAAQASAASLRALCAAPWFSQVQELDVDGFDFLDGLLAASPAGLRHLSLERNSRDNGVGLLCASDLAEQLTSLRLGGGCRGEEFETLARSPKLKRLHSLSFWNITSGDTGIVCEVLDSPHLTHLRELTYGGLAYPMPAEARERLPRQAGLARLQSLSLGGCMLKASDMANLARSRHLGGLRRLVLSGNYIGNGGLEALVEAPWLPALRQLSLVSCNFDVVGIRALAGCAALADLRILEMAAYEITDAAAEALADSPHLGGLVELRIVGTGGERPAIERLGERFGSVLRA